LKTKAYIMNTPFGKKGIPYIDVTIPLEGDVFYLRMPNEEGLWVSKKHIVENLLDAKERFESMKAKKIKALEKKRNEIALMDFESRVFDYT